MPSWKNDDKLSSAPSWLTEEDKRRCVRTNRGWELPLRGDGRTGGFELVVAMGQKGDPTRDTFGGSGQPGQQNDSPYWVYPDEMVVDGATAYTGVSAGATSVNASKETAATILGSTGGYTQGSFFPFVAAFPDHVINDAGPGHFQSADGTDTSTVHLRFFVSLTAGNANGANGITTGSSQVNGITSCVLSLIHLKGGTHELSAAAGASGDFNSGAVGASGGQHVFPGGSTLNSVGIVIQPAVGAVTDDSKAGFNPFVYIGCVAFEGSTGGVGGLTTYGQDIAGGLSAWRGLTLNRQ